jgi:hypothetical protein
MFFDDENRRFSKWEPWFAWYPISIRCSAPPGAGTVFYKKRVWLKTVLRRKHYWFGSEKFLVTWEYTYDDVFYQLSQ